MHRYIDITLLLYVYLWSRDGTEELDLRIRPRDFCSNTREIIRSHHFVETAKFYNSIIRITSITQFFVLRTALVNHSKRLISTCYEKSLIQSPGNSTGN
jgi:hypothetical protein